MFNNKNNSTKQKFSIKKYSFGVTSALVGVFLAAGVNSAQAEEVTSTSSEPIPTAVALEPSNSDLKINTTDSAEPIAVTATPITTELATENVPVSPVATSSTADIEPVAVTATPEASQVLDKSEPVVLPTAEITTEEESEVVRLANLYITSRNSPRFYTLSELGEQVTAPDAAASYFLPKSVVTASYNALSSEEITKEEALKKFLDGVPVDVINGNFNETVVLNKVNDKKQVLGAPGPLTFVLDFVDVDSLYVYTNEPFGVLGKTIIGDKSTWVKTGEELVVPVHYIDPVGNSVETRHLTLLSNNKQANLFESDGFVGKFFVYYIAGVSNLSQPAIPTQPKGNQPSKENPQSGKFKSTNKVTKSKANVLPKTSATETNSALPAGLAALLTAAGLMTVKRRKN